MIQRIITLTLLIICAISTAQNHHFKQSKNQLIWQKTYETNLDKKAILKQISQNAVLNSIKPSGQSDFFLINCDKKTPIYMRNNFRFYAHIDFKPGKYRVTLTNFQMRDNYTVEAFGVETTNNPISIDSFFIKKNGDFRSSKISRNAQRCFNDFLTDLFTFSKEEDW